MEDVNPFVMTYTGKERVYFLDPDPNAINIEDVAYQLSLQVRFTGACKFFYSVAQHSLLASRIVSSENALQALLHDATETYTGDINKPLKILLKQNDLFNEVIEKLEKAISMKFGVEYPRDPEVKAVDTYLLHLEVQNLLPESWYDEYPLLPYPDTILGHPTIVPMPDTQVYREFMNRFKELTEKV